MQATSPSVEPQPIFHRDGENFVATGFARGPWHADGQHGSAMLGLLARCIELHPAPRPMQVTRLTVDLLRAAPLSAVTVPTSQLRSGKTMDVVAAELLADGEVCARATAMRFRVTDHPIAEEPPRYGCGAAKRLPRAEDVPCPDGLESAFDEAFHMALEMRPHLGEEGPAMWYRMRAPLVEGEAITPLVRAAVVADWAYSVPFLHPVLMGGEREADPSFSAINPDTTLNLHRPAEGDWICVDSHVHYGSIGAGTALAWLTDERGPIGHSSQSVLVRDASKRRTAEQNRGAG